MRSTARLALACIALASAGCPDAPASPQAPRPVALPEGYVLGLGHYGTIAGIREEVRITPEGQAELALEGAAASTRYPLLADEKAELDRLIAALGSANEPAPAVGTPDAGSSAFAFRGTGSGEDFKPARALGRQVYARLAALTLGKSGPGEADTSKTGAGETGASKTGAGKAGGKDLAKASGPLEITLSRIPGPANEVRIGVTVTTHAGAKVLRPDGPSLGRFALREGWRLRVEAVGGDALQPYPFPGGVPPEQRVPLTLVPGPGITFEVSIGGWIPKGLVRGAKGLAQSPGAYHVTVAWTDAGATKPVPSVSAPLVVEVEVR